MTDKIDIRSWASVPGLRYSDMVQARVDITVPTLMVSTTPPKAPLKLTVLKARESLKGNQDG